MIDLLLTISLCLIVVLGAPGKTRKTQRFCAAPMPKRSGLRGIIAGA